MGFIYSFIYGSAVWVLSGDARGLDYSSYHFGCSTWASNAIIWFRVERVTKIGMLSTCV